MVILKVFPAHEFVLPPPISIAPVLNVVSFTVIEKVLALFILAPISFPVVLAPLLPEKLQESIFNMIFKIFL